MPTMQENSKRQANQGVADSQKSLARNHMAELLDYIDKLEAVARAAKKAHICGHDFQDDDGSLQSALAALEK